MSRSLGLLFTALLVLSSSAADAAKAKDRSGQRKPARVNKPPRVGTGHDAESAARDLIRLELARYDGPKQVEKRRAKEDRAKENNPGWPGRLTTSPGARGEIVAHELPGGGYVGGVGDVLALNRIIEVTEADGVFSATAHANVDGKKPRLRPSRPIAVGILLEAFRFME